MKKQLGFTLIEVAIVLVIIGLLLGGVLKGQELITQAKIKSVINDFTGVSTAVYAYQDRYRSLPGDDPGAARWSIITTPGNGDGVVSGLFNSTTATDESLTFWAHLRLSGFLTGDATTLASAEKPPQNSASGVLGVQWTPTAGVYGLAFQAPGLVICSTGLPGKIAESVDKQLDDGNPSTGAVRSYLTTTGAIPATSNAVNAAGGIGYIDDGQTLYTVCKLL